MAKKPLANPFFYDVNFKDIIINTKYIEPLEDILDEELNTHDWFAENKSSLNKGCIPDKKHLDNIFREIKPEVHEFLDIKDDIPSPSYNYFSLFNGEKEANNLLLQYALSGLFLVAIQPPFNLFSLVMGWFTYKQHKYLVKEDCSYRWQEGKIRLAKKNISDLKPIFAHEYDHYIQHFYGTNFFQSSIFPEGHARGVQKEIAIRLSKEENNKAYLQHLNHLTVMEIGNIYNHLCKVLGRTTKPSLAKRIKYDFNYLTCPHSYGNALMSVLERTHGKKIYSDILKGKLDCFR